MSIALHRYDKQIKLSVTLFISICVFLMAWLPYALVALIAQFGNRDVIGPFATSVCAVLAKSSVVLNPIVYSFRDRDLAHCLSLRWAWCLPESVQKRMRNRSGQSWTVSSNKATGMGTSTVRRAEMCREINGLNLEVIVNQNCGTEV